MFIFIMGKFPKIDKCWLVLMPQENFMKIAYWWRIRYFCFLQGDSSELRTLHIPLFQVIPFCT